MSPPSLSEFVEAAGASLAGAQDQLAGTELPVTAMAVSEAELQAKVAVESDPDGTLRVRPISLADATGGALDPETLSTIRVNFVALSSAAGTASTTRPSKTPDDVIKAVAARKDVTRLDTILGGLRYTAAFVPARRSWLVTATDDAQRVVRQVVIADQEG